MAVSVRRADFPFYAGLPVSIPPRGWLTLMCGVAIALAVLMLLPTRGFWTEMLVASLFAGIPLLTLAAVSGNHWRCLLQRTSPRDLVIMCLTAVAAMLASAAAALIVRTIFDIAPNPLMSEFGAIDTADYVRRLVPTLPQLLGEELLTALPFLAILWICTQRTETSKKMGVMIALIGSTAIFATAHLPTYQWNAAQCFGVIGTARIILTPSYIMTRNLWVSFGAHVLNDWTEFTLVFGLGHLPIGTASI